ncbi:hypothetical protein A2U01_0062839, partial [Trifolium medium]|nr:hypothetical protein [Trifolium medium]
SPLAAPQAHAPRQPPAQPAAAPQPHAQPPAPLPDAERSLHVRARNIESYHLVL